MPTKFKASPTRKSPQPEELVSSTFRSWIIDHFGLICYISVVLLTSGLFISSLYIGGITWDEGYAIPIISTHISTAFNNIPLIPDPQQQHLIYYGMIHLLPGYLLSSLVGNYYLCSHIFSFLYGVLASYYIAKICRLLGLRFNVSYLAASLLLLYPIWLGHSFFNDKDLPAGVFFTIFTYYCCKCLASLQKEQSISLKLYIKLILSAAILAGVKFAFFPLVVADVVLISLFYKENLQRRVFFLLRTLILMLFVTVVFTPGAWYQPITYMINDIALMSKFDWNGCVNLMNKCVITSSPQWNAAKYLFSWYIVQIPLAILLLFILGVIYLIYSFKRFSQVNKKMVLILLVQLLLLPLLAIIRNSAFYDATRHTLFCLPMLIAFAGFGMEYILSIRLRPIKYGWLIISGWLSLVTLVDDILLNPYQYVYFNEVARQYINYKNTDLDYWGFSLRETFNGIDMMKYYSPYVSMENGPEPATLRMFMRGQYTFVHYDKTMQLPIGTSINVIGLLRGHSDSNVTQRINQERCELASQTSRPLLFKSDPLILSMDFYCN